MEARDKNGSFRSRLNAVIGRAEHIGNKYKKRVLIAAALHIFAEVGGIDHFAQEDILLLGCYGRPAHEFCVHRIKSRGITLSYLESAYSHARGSLVLALGIVINAPVRAEFLDAGGKYLYIHSCRVEVRGHFTQFHFRAAGNTVGIPRNNKTYLFHHAFLFCFRIICLFR